MIVCDLHQRRMLSGMCRCSLPSLFVVLAVLLRCCVYARRFLLWLCAWWWCCCCCCPVACLTVPDVCSFSWRLQGRLHAYYSYYHMAVIARDQSAKAYIANVDVNNDNTISQCLTGIPCILLEILESETYTRRELLNMLNCWDVASPCRQVLGAPGFWSWGLRA